MALIDSYSETNRDGVVSLSSANNQIASQSFTNTLAHKLTSCKWFIQKTGSPTGNAVAKIYAHTGTYGTSSQPTGVALATSDNFDVSTLTTSYALTTFTFSGAAQIDLSASTYYVVTIEYSGGTAGDRVDVGLDGSSPTASGNGAVYYGEWLVVSYWDFPFYVYGDLPDFIAAYTAVSMVATIPSITANSVIEPTAIYTPLSLVATIPSTTVTYVYEQTADYTPVSMVATIPATTSTWVSVWTAVFTAVSMVLSIPSMVARARAWVFPTKNTSTYSEKTKNTSTYSEKTKNDTSYTYPTKN